MDKISRMNEDRYLGLIISNILVHGNEYLFIYDHALTVDLVGLPINRILVLSDYDIWDLITLEKVIKHLTNSQELVDQDIVHKSKMLSNEVGTDFCILNLDRHNMKTMEVVMLTDLYDDTDKLNRVPIIDNTQVFEKLSEVIEVWRFF